MQTIHKRKLLLAALLLTSAQVQAESAADYPDPAQIETETTGPVETHHYPEPRQVELEMARPATIHPVSTSQTASSGVTAQTPPGLPTTSPTTVQTTTPTPTSVTTTESAGGYLGISISTLSEALRAQLPESLDKKQGLVVVWLADQSPAADDGIKMHDILIELDGQPLDNPETFFKAIQKKKAGEKASFKLVRQSEVIEVPVTIGRQPSGQPADRQQQQILAAQAAQQAARQQAQAAARNQPKTGYRPGYAPRPGMPYYPGPYAAPYSQPRAQPPGAAMSGMTGMAAAPQAVPLNITGQPSYPMRKKIVVKKEAWGDKRNIWSDFYTDFTGDMWDSMINAPFDVGRMPGGWRAPTWSSPDPVTVGDAVLNQAPPFIEEAGNMLDFSD